MTKYTTTLSEIDLTLLSIAYFTQNDDYPWQEYYSFGPSVCSMGDYPISDTIKE